MRKVAITIIIIVSCLACVVNALATPPAGGGPPPKYFDIDVDGYATELDTSDWLYEYTLSIVPKPGYIFKDMSHWWLELPQEKISTLSDFDPSGTETYFNEAHAPSGLYTTLGNPFLGHHYGVKWDSNQMITYSFISTHAPVYNEENNYDYGAYSWYSRDGVDGAYWDWGTTLGPNGGENPVPEPLSLSLLSIGLLGLIGLRRRKNA